MNVLFINFVRLINSMFSIVIATVKTIALPFSYCARMLYSTVMFWVSLEVYDLDLDKGEKNS